MKYLFFLLGAFFLAVGKVTILPFNFLIPLLLLGSFSFGLNQALFLAFTAGLFQDLASASLIGYSSLVFLLSLTGLLFLKRRFSFNSFQAGFFLTLGFYSVVQLLLQKRLAILEAIIFAVIIAFFNLRKKEKIQI